jgi:hypothetical protein
MTVLSTTERVEQARAVPRTRYVVPWRTVATLAIVLSFADGFWLTSLRGAVGAIERTQSPFASFLRESTFLLPAYAIAVLGALTLARRWFGPELRRPRAVLTTAVLVAVAGTLLAVVVTATSSAYDYHLQSTQLQHMHAMNDTTRRMLELRQAATLHAHVQGVVLISRWLLLTNAVLVAWVVAMWGGRLKVSETRGAREGASLLGSDRAHQVRLLLVGALVGSAAIHAAVVPEHLAEWSAAGLFFMVLTMWELAVAGMLLARLEERTMLLAAVLVSVLPLALWLVSRTVGLPFGPEPGEVEAIGLADCMACLLEIASLVAAGLLLLRGRALRLRAPLSAHGSALVVLVLLTVTLLGVAGVGLSWFDVFDLSGPQAMDMSH